MQIQERDASKALMASYDQIISTFATSFKPPQGMTNADTEQHYIVHLAAARRFYSSRLKKFFDEEYEKSKKLLVEGIAATNPNVVPQVGAKLVEMYSDDQFVVFYTVRNGPSRLDDKKLRMLLVAAGVEPDVVEDCFSKARVQGEAQTIIDIVPVGDTSHEDR